ncbi:MAG: hypothetical protein ACJAVV_003505 [Alphaproteobacteria bacterium]|jgi:hypothetical protein
MADIQSNTIKSLTKVIDAAQSGYAPRGLPTRAPSENQAQALTLNVISVKNTHILLQEQTSGKRLLIEKSALQSTTNTNLAEGDSLILLSANQKAATFVVEKNIQQYPNKLTRPALQGVAESLSVQWSDIPIGILKKAPPVILNQLQIPSNTQQAAGLANAVVTLASVSGQPTVTVNTSADVLFIKSPFESAQTSNSGLVDKSVADALRLAIRFSTNSNLFIDIPLSNKTTNTLTPSIVAEIKGLFTSGQKVNVQFDANSRLKLVTNITLHNAPKTQLSAIAISEINKVLSNQFSNIKQAISSLIVAPHSPNLRNGIVLASSIQNLQGLGAAAKQNLTQGVSPAVLQSASILIAQSQQNTNQIQVSLLAKPTTVNIENSQLSSISLASGIAKNTTNTLVQLRANEAIPINGATELSVFGKTKVHNMSGESGSAITAGHTDEAGNVSKASQVLKTKLFEFLAKKGNDPQAISTKIDKLQSNIYRELNQVLPRAESTTQALPTILTQLQSVGKDATGELKQLINQVSLQIKSNLPASDPSLGDLPSEFTDSVDEIIASQSTRQIEDMLTSAVLPNVSGAPIQTLGALNSQSGLINGLVTMLQASLQAKLMAHQPQLLPALLQSSQFPQMLPKALGKAGTPANHAKLLQELGKLDPRGNLISELNKVLSNHSLHKLSSAESSLQNQDSFYYILPNMFSSQHKDIELMIKREHQTAGEEEQQTQQAWQLSMKLDIGENGDVLAKVKLASNKLDLNLYASNQNLKEKILNYLPYLNKRLESLGLQVSPKCYVGKIPNTLHKTDYQLVQAYV